MIKERITQGSHITYYALMFFIAYAFKGQVHVFAVRVKIVSHSFKYFCPQPSSWRNTSVTLFLVLRMYLYLKIQIVN